MSTTRSVMDALRLWKEGDAAVPTFEAVADRAGVSERTLSRTMRVLERRGSIAWDGDRLVLRDERRGA